MPFIALLVEGNLDEVVGRRLADLSGFEVAVTYGKKGIGYIRSKIADFNATTSSIPILALADLMDTGLKCPPSVVASWLPRRNENMLLRVVVREIESWLLADRLSIADFLKIPPDKVPDRPEEVVDPKLGLVNLARKSRSSTIRRLVVPAAGSTAREGPAYGIEMQRFVQAHWRPDVAQRNAPSLAKCLKAIGSLRRS